MQANVLVSIVIPAYNAESTLAQCLQACARQTHPDTEVIVVDDGSTDGTPRIAQSFSVDYIRQENLGPGAARNRGAEAAKGEIVACTDADCVPEPEWIASLLQGFLSEDTVAVGGTYAIANASSALARMIHEEIAIRHEGFGRDVDFLGSFNVAFRREAFDAAGGFDPSFTYASAEDNDLSYRLADQGGGLRFTPEARVAHYHPERLWPYLRTQARHGFWRMKLYAKHPNRAKSGDQYAGLLDLSAPPLSLAALAALAVLLLSPAISAPGWLVGCAGVVIACYALIHVPLALRMAQRRREPAMLIFAGVAALRDVARALGMAQGMVVFLILRKGRA